jgi:hypothetical protein
MITARSDTTTVNGEPHPADRQMTGRRLSGARVSVD